MKQENGTGLSLSPLPGPLAIEDLVEAARSEPWRFDFSVHLYLHAIRIDPPHYLSGIDPLRCVEYSFALERAMPRPDEHILDVGSADSLLPTFLLTYGAHVVAIDLDEPRLKTQERFLANLLNHRTLVPEKLQLLQMDARQMSFSDSSFDKIIAISTIEHIPGDGDLEAMREIARVLKPRGILSLTLPFGATFTETERASVGYEKRYDEARVERLVESSGLQLQRKQFFGPRLPGHQEILDRWYKNGLWKNRGMLGFLLSLACVQVTDLPKNDSGGVMLCMGKTAV